ncbi:MAG TPA: serine hydrolase domain-containing protein [Candidatus Baltobacteraceae bacterium]|nr:serine hydrolase domain-containing protein [Candidatus Baltobacteraceae bacterium]
MKTILCTMAALSLLAVTGSPRVDPTSLDSVMRGALAADRITGAQVGVAVNGKLVANAGYGFEDVGTHAPVTPATHFEIGSTTKQFTAAAILQLREAGKLRLDDPLGKYVPDYPLGKSITIEQLLWQVSGIPDYLNDVPHIERIAIANPAGGLDAVLGAIKGRPLYFAPGTQWRYSNTNYVLLGAIVDRVSHMPWEEYVRRNVFTRAGMTQSAFIGDEARLAHMASGYGVDERGNPKRALTIPEGWAGAAGAIVSTAGDMAKWDDAFFSGKIVDAADVRLATTAHVLPSGASTGYGFGWFVDTLDGQKRIWHGGETLGFDALNEYFPQLGEAEIILTNAANESALPDAAVFESLHPQIASAVSHSASGEDPKVTALAKQWWHRLQTGDIDRSQLTPQWAVHYTPQHVEQIKAELAARGEPLSWIYRGETGLPDGLTQYSYRVTFKAASVTFGITLAKDGKIAGFSARS